MSVQIYIKPMSLKDVTFIEVHCCDLRLPHLCCSEGGSTVPHLRHPIQPEKGEEEIFCGDHGPLHLQARRQGVPGVEGQDGQHLGDQIKAEPR